jgi:hypothetical protein
LGDAGDGGQEDDGEESADVEEKQLFFERPRKGEKKKNADGEEDVTANFSAGSPLVRCKVFGAGAGQLNSPGFVWVSPGYRLLDAD